MVGRGGKCHARTRDRGSRHSTSPGYSHPWAGPPSASPEPETAMPRTAAFALLVGLFVLAARAQEKSVKPGINDAFKDPNVSEFVGKFEIESREVFTARDKVVAACGLKPGMVVADVGAGTGLYARLFAKAVGPD